MNQWKRISHQISKFTHVEKTSIRKYCQPHAGETPIKPPQKSARALPPRKSESDLKKKPNRRNETLRSEEAPPSPRSIQRLPKRVYALLLGYCGKDYHGLQINQQQAIKTVEGALFEALGKSQAIAEYNADKFLKNGIARSSRTDKSVHALGVVLRAKLVEKASLVEDINEFLPRDIRVFSVCRVAKGFCPRFSIDRRTYSYYVPSYLFSSRFLIGDAENLPAQETISAFRLSADEKKQLGFFCSGFEGCLNFHNYTRQVSFYDMKARRTIHRFSPSSEPFFWDDCEMIRFDIVGQSFLYHQIRKMVGILSALTRNLISIHDFYQTFTAEKFHLPLAPGEGLLLRESHFEAYNFMAQEKKMRTLNFDSPSLRNEIQNFAQAVIFPVMKNDLKSGCFLIFLQKLHHFHHFHKNLQISPQNSTLPPSQISHQPENFSEISNSSTL
eukprot:Sdes_comp20336_c0_seq1m14070